MGGFKGFSFYKAVLYSGVRSFGKHETKYLYRMSKDSLHVQTLRVL